MARENGFWTRTPVRWTAAACAAVVLVAALTSPVACQAPPARNGAPRGTPPGATTVSQPRPIRVGAWNIEWLGTPGRRSGPARGHAQAAADLADYITAADVAILGVEEIAETAAAAPATPQGWVDRTNATLQAAFDVVRQRGRGQWRHRLYPARTGRNQLCGVAWDTTRVTAVGTPVALTTSDPETQSVWSRPPFAQTFSAGAGLTDFAVITVHMKSNYNGDFSERRGREAEELAAALPGTLTDPDVIILGDANCGSHGEPAVARLEAAGFVDLNAADASTHIRYGPLDRVFVPRAQPEFAGRHFEVVREGYLAQRGLTETDFKVRYSDHFMVVTEVTIGPDDD